MTVYSDTMGDSGGGAPMSRDQHKADVRTRIIDSVLVLLADGADVNHDRVAERAGVARRTVYRYFPDQAALMQPVWECVTALAGTSVTLPDSEEAMLASMPEIYRAFDAVAPLATVIRSTALGRAVRLAQKDQRTASYRAAVADAVKDLPEQDGLLATALLQVLHTTPWLEMRDDWSLSGDQVALACGWAMQVLLKDLRARGDRPLADGPA
ncbi:TetR/AcrR family transcriptional regulator [Sphingobium sufflavum]|uniref:TetR/AcrR family transcriptional regulator n=1 Tax=Sphingobium sufflavum TaxID=1129547 RepID=UPI001F2AF41E|nr:TetR family transcriptional regulator [Sphingobium sufflavum]MCE7795110.1 TetR/AcrR family transcriptional regulator [Sphingobium sufflavum]